MASADDGRRWTEASDDTVARTRRRHPWRRVVRIRIRAATSPWPSRRPLLATASVPKAELRMTDGPAAALLLGGGHRPTTALRALTGTSGMGVIKSSCRCWFTTRFRSANTRPTPHESASSRHAGSRSGVRPTVKHLQPRLGRADISMYKHSRPADRAGDRGAAAG